MPLTKKRNERNKVSLGPENKGTKVMMLKSQVDATRLNPIAISSLLIRKNHYGVIKAYIQERGRIIRAKHASREQYRHMETLIARELTMTFGKSDEQVRELLNKVKIGSLLAKHPLSLHESPQNWAVGILTKAKDWDTLDRYYSR